LADEFRESPNGRAEAHGATPPPAEPVPVVRCLADVEARPVAWVWERWIPRGALTILDGDPGLGKSTLMMDLAARITRGWGMPPAGDGAGGEPAGVLLLTAEDALDVTVRPRLDAAGADPARVHALEAVKTGDDERPPVLPWDLALVESLIAYKGVRLIVADPIMAYLDGQLDAHRDQDVRRLLHQLMLLADRTGTAIVLVRHLNTLTGPPALYRGGGSIGIIGAVRSALLVGRHPSEAHHYVLASNKCNLAARPR